MNASLKTMIIRTSTYDVSLEIKGLNRHLANDFAKPIKLSVRRNRLTIQQLQSSKSCTELKNRFDIKIKRQRQLLLQVKSLIKFTLR